MFLTLLVSPVKIDEVYYHNYAIAHTVLCVFRSNEQVVRDVVQVASKFQPRASHADVVSCAFPLTTQEQG
jgi:hypothetical protein